MPGLLVSLASALIALALTAAPAAAARVALVIGNAAYPAQPLANPGNDAADIAAALGRLGFSVIAAGDLDKRGMDDAFRRFARAAEGAEAAVFYYAGHAMQFEGANYLVPVDAALERETDIPYETARLDDALAAMGRAKGVRIAILDACRNNPLETRLKRTLAESRGGVPTRGLARIANAGGMLIAYATQANAVASDGAGRNSPFTAALLGQIETPGLEVGPMFRRVATAVNAETGGQQTPEVSISLLGEFHFAGEGAPPAGPGQAVAPAVPPAPSAPPAGSGQTAAVAAPERWQATIDLGGRRYTCVNQTEPNGRYRLSQGCPPPVAGETGWSEVTADGAWRIRADTGRVDFGTVEVLGPGRILVRSLGGPVIWTRLDRPAAQ